MSTINSKNVQVGTSGVAAQNFTLYQPATPDGTVRLGVGNSGATTGDVVTVNSAGVTVTGTLTATTLSGAGSFTTLAASSTVSGTGFSTYLASPPAIGGTAAAAGSFTTLSASGNMSFNSGYGSAAVAYGCRAWVNFNGTGTVAIRASANVTSLTDNGTGNYTVNLTTSMPDANYSVVANHDADNYSDAVDARASGTLLQTLATGSFILRTYLIGGAGTNQQTARDYTTNTAAVFR